MTRVRWVLAIACAGCGTSRPPYEVIAVANIQPGTETIAGPLEVLGIGEPGPDSGGYHMLVVDHLRLPSDRPRRIRLYTTFVLGSPYTPASCDTPHADTRPIWNLGEIRRVGDETHFFVDEVEIGDRVLSVDVRTQFAFINLEAEGDSQFYPTVVLAVVEELVPGAPNGTGFVFDPQGSGPRDWLACGAFVVPK